MTYIVAAIKSPLGSIVYVPFLVHAVQFCSKSTQVGTTVSRAVANSSANQRIDTVMRTQSHPPPPPPYADVIETT